jgi:hypothetical protein
MNEEMRLVMGANQAPLSRSVRWYGAASLIVAPLAAGAAYFVWLATGLAYPPICAAKSA